MKQKAIRVNDRSETSNDHIYYWYDENLETWFMWFPGVGTGNLKNHTVVENSDKTITVSPSIVVGHTGHKKVHGYLKSGWWQDC